MNDERHSETSSFEKQLLALTPAAASTSEAEIMYACGYQAGLAAAENSNKQSLTHSPKQNRSHRWAQLLLAACFSCIIVGPTAYLLGKRNAMNPRRLLTVASGTQTKMHEVTSNDNQQNSDAVSNRTETENTASRSEKRPLTVPTQINTQPSPNQTTNYATQPTSAFADRLTELISAWLSNPLSRTSIMQNPQYRYLTSRNSQYPYAYDDSTTPFDQRQIMNLPSDIAASVNSSSSNISEVPQEDETNSHSATKRKQLNYFESLRNISTESQGPSLLHWLN